MNIEARLCLARDDFTLDVDLCLPARGVSALFGPSGCGKTTLLRCIAGLERRCTGRLVVDGACWQDETCFSPPYRRPIGYVFQDANLFAHLNVAGNLDYASRRCGNDSRTQRDLIDMLGIGSLLGRRVQGLSGGERQRVAIARALLAAPRLLLLDEPLAALDRERKRDILPYLERLRDEIAIPMLYVSHATEEVARLADHLVVMEAGRVLAEGQLQDIVARLDLPMARDADAGVVIDATVTSHDSDYHLTRLDFPGGTLFAGLHRAASALPPGGRARLAVRARDVSLALTPPHDSSILNHLPAVIEAFADAEHPAHLLVRLDVGGTPLLARISRRSYDQLGLRTGLRVWALVKTVALVD